MEYYLDYSGVELDDDVDLNKGSIWDWTDKYTHYLIVEQNFAEVLDGIGYDKAKELVKSWKPSIKTEAISKEATTWAVVNTEHRKDKENLIPIKVEGKITPITFRGWAYGERQHEYSTGSIRATFETENEAMNYIKLTQTATNENLINRDEPPYYNFNEFWFHVARYWLDCDAERSELEEAFYYGMEHPYNSFDQCPVIYDYWNHYGEYLELAFLAGQESSLD